MAKGEGQAALALAFALGFASTGLLACVPSGAAPSGPVVRILGPAAVPVAAPAPTPNVAAASASAAGRPPPPLEVASIPPSICSWIERADIDLGAGRLRLFFAAPAGAPCVVQIDAIHVSLGQRDERVAARSRPDPPPGPLPLVGGAGEKTIELPFVVPFEELSCDTMDGGQITLRYRGAVEGGDRRFEPPVEKSLRLDCKR